MNRLRVLTFHRIGDRGGSAPYDPKLFSADAETFEQQIAWLARSHEFVSAQQVLEAFDTSARLPRRAVLVTFDDAYPDFKSVAWPVLKRYKVPAILFVPTDYPSNTRTPFWWDSLNAALVQSQSESLDIEPFGTLALTSAEEKARASALIRSRVKQLPHDEAMEWLCEIKNGLGISEQQLESTLTWNELRRLADEGVTLGAHGRSHALLTAVSPDRAAEEIAGSLSDLRREVGNVLPIFCYPAGAHDRRVLEEAERAGVRIGFTTETGQNDLDRCEPLAMRRLNITPRTNVSILRARLTVAGNFLDRMRRKWQ